MKKRNLAILLIIPFLVSLFGIVTINAAFNLVENDVVRIEWDYRGNELFNLDGGRKLLEARGVLAKETEIGSAGSKLVWSVENADGAEEPHAAIESPDNINSYLVPLSVGHVTVTCTTEKGNIAPMQMSAYIYSGNAFVINTKTDASAQNVDGTLYYGRYDRDPSTGAKVDASIPFDLAVSDEELLQTIVWDRANSTPNIEVEMGEGEGVIRVKGTFSGPTEAVFCSSTEQDIASTFSFTVVPDGVNVYTYDDLLACTNRSERGEVVVLRKHFESLANFEGSTASNVALFGTRKERGFNFSEEVYRFPTTYNHEYIDQWNEWVKTPDGSGYSPVGLDVIAGLRVQKDFYGNGYRLNLHNLCYPSLRRETSDGQGETYDVAVLGPNDLFRGPKPFYLLGDPNGTAPLVTAYGQDNVGIYLDGDNILFDDVKVSNADFGLVVSNLNYTGTVLEVCGDNTTVENCVLQNGKNILRSFSSEGLTVENCILSTSRNFLLEVGSNNYVKNDPADSSLHSFTLLDGSTYSATTASYLSPEAPEGLLLGDKTLSLFVAGFADLEEALDPSLPSRYDPATQREQMKAALHSLQRGLDQAEAVGENFDGTTVVKDTLFYRSGIASIGVNNMFNGPFLYNNAPSLISGILGLLGGMLDVAIPMFPDNVSGASRPVSVELTGDTRFYDYKSLSDWDISGLIDQHIGDLVAGLDMGSFDITIDDIFPLKSILTQVARSASLTCTVEAKEEGTSTEYISIPVAYYGGGRNASSVTAENIEQKVLSPDYNVDLLDSYLNFTTKLDLSALANGGVNGVLSNPNFIRYMKEVLTKTVTAVTGFEPFRFQFETSPDGLFDENGKPISPDYRDIIRNERQEEIQS